MPSSSPSSSKRTFISRQYSKYVKMTEIKQILNDGMALRNIYEADPTRHYDDKCHHQIIILF